MSPSAQEIEQMAKLKNIMEGNFCDSVLENIDKPITSMASESESDPTGTKAMKAILERFYQGVNSCVDDAVETGDRVLIEASVTNPTPSGVQIGRWEIKSDVVSGVTSYSVINGGMVVAEGVTLYESALGMCRLLNTRVSITDKKFIEILTLESDYMHHRSEAVIFKKKAISRRQEGDYERADISEARYSEARANALAIREKIIVKSNTF